VRFPVTTSPLREVFPDSGSPDDLLLFFHRRTSLFPLYCLPTSSPVSSPPQFVLPLPAARVWATWAIKPLPDTPAWDLLQWGFSLFSPSFEVDCFFAYFVTRPSVFHLTLAGFFFSGRKVTLFFSVLVFDRYLTDFIFRSFDPNTPSWLKGFTPTDPPKGISVFPSHVRSHL